MVDRLWRSITKKRLDALVAVDLERRLNAICESHSDKSHHSTIDGFQKSSPAKEKAKERERRVWLKKTERAKTAERVLSNRHYRILTTATITSITNRYARCKMAWPANDDAARFFSSSLFSGLVLFVVVEVITEQQWANMPNQIKGVGKRHTRPFGWKRRKRRCNQLKYGQKMFDWWKIHVG